MSSKTSSTGPVSRHINRTTDQNINGVLSSTAWATQNITYSFPTSAAGYDASYPTTDPQHLSAFNAQQRLLVTKMFKDISSFTNLTFTPVTETATNHALLRFANSSVPATSYAFYPSDSPSGGDVWIGTSTKEDLTPGRGQYGWTTIFHETGHALGLKHGQETDVYGAMDAAHNDTEYSIMDYNSYIGSPYTDQFITNEQSSFPQSYMMYDIAALQYMYGAKFDPATKNAVYSWSQATGEAFINGVSQGKPSGNRIYQTIWNGGGNATYYLGNFSQNTYADMRPGQYIRFSDKQLANLDIASGTTHLARGNVYNALQYNGDKRSLIANITTGIGNDTIYGNDGGNNIDAGAGNNLVYAGSGNNRIKVGNGFSTVYGGNGNDTITADAGAKTGVLFWSGAGGNDILTGGGGNDVLHGTGADFSSDAASSKYLAGGGGNDTIYGGAGNDVIYGGDATMVHSGNNRMFGGAGNDTMYGGDGEDYFQGGLGSDYMVGGSGNEVFFTASTDLSSGQNDTISHFHVGDLLSFSADLRTRVSAAQSGTDTILTIAANGGFYHETVLATSLANVTAALKFV